MTALIDRLFRLKLATSISADDEASREDRLAAVRALIAEIAEPAGESDGRDAETCEADPCCA